MPEFGYLNVTIRVSHNLGSKIYNSGSKSHNLGYKSHNSVK